MTTTARLPADRRGSRGLAATGMAALALAIWASAPLTSEAPGPMMEADRSRRARGAAPKGGE